LITSSGIPPPGRRGNPDWLFQYEDFVAQARRDDFATPRFLGKTIRERRSIDDFGFGLGQGLAFLAGEKDAEFFRVQGDEIEPPAQEVRAHLAGHLFPTRKGGISCHDRGLGVLRGDAGEDRAICWIGNVKSPAIRAIDPSAANKSLIAQEFYIAWAHVSLAGRVAIGEGRRSAPMYEVK
jgi:hypothetical protein